MAISEKGKRSNNYKPVEGIPPHILEGRNLSAAQKIAFGRSAKAEAKSAPAKKSAARKSGTTTAAKGKRATAKQTKQAKQTKPAESAGTE